MATVLAGAAGFTTFAQANASGSPRIQATTYPLAMRYCTDPRTADGKPRPQRVHGIRVVVVCVQNYQYIPGDNRLVPCAGFDDDPALRVTHKHCTTTRRPIPANPLEVAQGTLLLFVVPDPNMHTLTSVRCPNVFQDPTTVGPLPSLVGSKVVEATRVAEEATFGPDDIRIRPGSCLFDSYRENHDQLLAGPAYQSVDTTNLAPGTYHFYCQAHAFMRGTLVVDKRG
jgi:plastocyanin